MGPPTVSTFRRPPSKLLRPGQEEKGEGIPFTEALGKAHRVPCLGLKKHVLSHAKILNIHLSSLSVNIQATVFLIVLFATVV